MKFWDETLLMLPGDGIRLQWRWDPQNTVSSLDCEFVVERSGGPKGPWEELGTVNPRTTFSFHDDTAPMKSLGHSGVYYRLRAVQMSTQEDVGASGAIGLNGRVLMPERHILSQQTRLLEGVNGHPATKGRPVTIYKKVVIGPNCPVCSDRHTGRTMMSDCRSCIGTGTDFGYYDPLTVGANIQPYAASRQLTNLQAVDGASTVGVINNNPIVDPGDILVEVDERHWRVIRRDVRERNRVILRQILYLEPLKPDDVASEMLRHRDNGGRA